MVAPVAFWTKNLVDIADFAGALGKHCSCPGLFHAVHRVTGITFKQYRDPLSAFPGVIGHHGRHRDHAERHWCRCRAATGLPPILFWGAAFSWPAAGCFGTPPDAPPPRKPISFRSSPGYTGKLPEFTRCAKISGLAPTATSSIFQRLGRVPESSRHQLAFDKVQDDCSGDFPTLLISVAGTIFIPK